MKNLKVRGLLVVSFMVTHGVIEGKCGQTLDMRRALRSNAIANSGLNEFSMQLLGNRPVNIKESDWTQFLKELQDSVDIALSQEPQTKKDQEMLLAQLGKNTTEIVQVCLGKIQHRTGCCWVNPFDSQEHQEMAMEVNQRVKVDEEEISEVNRVLCEVQTAYVKLVVDKIVSNLEQEGDIHQAVDIVQDFDEAKDNATLEVSGEGNDQIPVFMADQSVADSSVVQPYSVTDDSNEVVMSPDLMAVQDSSSLNGSEDNQNLAISSNVNDEERGFRENEGNIGNNNFEEDGGL